MVASLSEEVIHPEKNMPIGIVGSLVVSTLIYVSVSLCVVGMAPFIYLGETIPIVNALMVNACCSHLEQIEQMGNEQTEVCLRECQLPYEKPIMAVAGHVVSGGAIFGLIGACFTSLMGQPRIVSLETVLRTCLMIDIANLHSCFVPKSSIVWPKTAFGFPYLPR